MKLPLDDDDHTVMTYTFTGPKPQSLQELDRGALDYLYGASLAGWTGGPPHALGTACVNVAGCPQQCTP